MSRQVADKPRAEVRQDRFGLLEAIAKEIGKNVVFSVSFDLSSRICDTLRDPTASVEKIAREVERDPLVVAKLLQLCNSVAYNPAREHVTDLLTALKRVGMETARSVALACALAQLSKNKDHSIFADDFRRLLEHSLKAAGIARFLARQLCPKVKPDTAMLAGLIHDLGAFYLLDLVAQRPELVERPVTARHLVAQWHESIGLILLDTLSIPQEIIDAVSDVDTPRITIQQPKNLTDIVYLANIFAGGFEETKLLDLPGLTEPAEFKLPIYTDLAKGLNQAAQEMFKIW